MEDTRTEQDLVAMEEHCERLTHKYMHLFIDKLNHAYPDDIEFDLKQMADKSWVIRQIRGVDVTKDIKTLAVLGVLVSEWLWDADITNVQIWYGDDNVIDDRI